MCKFITPISLFSTANISISPPARKKSVKQVRKTSVPVVVSPKSPDVKPDVKPSINNGSIELKNRMTKDPNAPRYPSTSYTLFLAERRAAEVAAHPDLKAFEISRIMGEKWRLVSDEDKVPYVEKAAKLKKEYEAAIKIYNKTDESKNWIKFQREKNKNSNVKSSGKKKRKLKNGDEEKEENPHIDDIPIFSQAFLTYNKEQDRKLRQIRLKTGEVADEQNGLRKRLAMLQKHAARHSVNEDGGRLDELHAQVWGFGNFSKKFYNCKFSNFSRPSTTSRQSAVQSSQR